MSKHIEYQTTERNAARGVPSLWQVPEPREAGKAEIAELIVARQSRVGSYGLSA